VTPVKDVEYTIGEHHWSRLTLKSCFEFAGKYKFISHGISD